MTLQERFDLGDLVAKWQAASLSLVKSQESCDTLRDCADELQAVLDRSELKS